MQSWVLLEMLGAVFSFSVACMAGKYRNGSKLHYSYTLYEFLVSYFNLVPQWKTQERFSSVRAISM